MACRLEAHNISVTLSVSSTWSKFPCPPPPMNPCSITPSMFLPVNPPFVIPTGRLDLKDLPWEDRERVLRLLFARLNNQAQHLHYTNLPAHPLETQVAATATAAVYMPG
jgi:hypothetical protein